MSISISISITQNSQSVSDNTSNVTVAVKASWTYGSYNKLEKSGWLTIDGTKYTFTSPFNTGQSTSGSQTLFSKTVNVEHGSNGAKTLSCSASYTSGVSSGTVTASASKVLTTIPRKSSLSASNGTLGTAQTLTVTRKSTSFTHTITYKCGNTSGTIATKSSSTSISWTPPISLANQNTTGTTVSVTFTITTYNGSTSIGSETKTITCTIPASVKPTCAVAVTDAAGHAATYGGYIKGLSKFKVVVTPTTSYGSAIASYKTTANGATYTNASFTTDVLKTSGTLTVSATVTDKRGRSGSASASLTVLNYAAPNISKFVVKRCNADGTENNQGAYVQATFSCTVNSLNSKNSAAYKLEYKKTSDSAFTAVTLTDLAGKYSVTDSKYVFPAETGSSYDVRLTVTDDFGSAAKTTSASTAFTLIHWLASGLGMAIGKIAELANVLDIGFQTRFSGGILHPILEPETDLNDVKTPNTYVGANTANYNYANCPLEDGTFTLEVVGCGVDGQVKQKLTNCRKTDARTFERFFYQSAWGEWVCTSDFEGTLLWSGGYYMSAGQTVTFYEPVVRQQSGILLVFCEYVDGAYADQAFHCRFVPKRLIGAKEGKEHVFMMTTGNLATFATKTLYISDDKIVGHANNNTTGTGTCGIKYTNNKFVLRYVFGV